MRLDRERRARGFATVAGPIALGRLRLPLSAAARNFMRRSAPGAARPAAVTGMLLGVLAYFLFALHDASIKWLVGRGIPVWQVLCFRSTIIVGFCLAGGGRALLERAAATPIKRVLLGRGAITLLAWLCYYSAARTLPLAQLLTLYFAAPIITTLLAVPMLRERVPVWRWVSVACGFAGVVVACDPGGVAFTLATGLVLIAAAFWGYAVILMRQTALRESNLLLMLYTNGLFLLVTAIGCAAVRWQTPTWRETAMLLAVGAIGSLAQLALFEGMRHAAASVMATVEYSALVWAFILGFVIWGDIPRVAVFVGAGLILAAGALLLATERRAANRQNS
jgi:drug/metabolite transporter (DMT)-like permease